MDILSQIADAMQVVLNETANAIARITGLIKRQRKLKGSDFVKTLVFSWLSNPDSTNEEFAQTAASIGVSISPQGLDKRFTSNAANFLKKVLESAVAATIESEPVAIPILQRFNGVFIQDSSVTILPDCLAVIWPGCGGSSPKNTSSSIKTQVRIDLNTGKLMGPYLQSGREHDKSSPLKIDSLPKGSVRITDLEYFSLDDFDEMDNNGVYWLSRVKSQCNVYLNGKQWDLLDLLQQHCPDKMDIQAQLGAKRVSCRIIATRVPDEVGDARREKIKEKRLRRCQTPSIKLLKLADWTVICTNIPSELLSLDEGLLLIRTRWQIELLFKLWKSEGHIDKSRSEKPFRILCELYAKLIVVIIQHWILLTSWQYPDRSMVKSVRTIRKHAMNLAIAFASGVREELLKALKTIVDCLCCGCRINKRKTIKHTYQLLLGVT